ncbi:MFS transporter [Kitasatospora indigofera]|uniref:MFS transporter n=1 Tax=Kitasatospora indigofera TaxID=67307 RepID=A0A918YV51_9ACTN|nr:MFS transporter [Kitasatospora indigofera]GHE24991.1 MFS transporter [Kitasatospora indigofera]
MTMTGVSPSTDQDTVGQGGMGLGGVGLGGVGLSGAAQDATEQCPGQGPATARGTTAGTAQAEQTGTGPDRADRADRADRKPAQPVPLRRNLRFQLLWGGSAASTLGLHVTDTAYPLLLLAMTGSSTLAGAFGALQMAASVLCGVHGGSVADRYDRRRVLIAADSVRLLATLSVPLAMALDAFSVAHALLVAVVTGATLAYSGPVRLLAVRSVVAPEQLRQALAQDEARMSGAGLAGPPLAGLLLGAGRAVPFLGAALASLLSLATACLVRFPGRAEPAAPADAAPADTVADEATGTTTGAAAAAKDSGALAGFRHLLADRTLRSTLAVVFGINLVGSAVVLPVIVVLRDQGVSSGGIGLALAGEAVGAMAGALLVARLHRLAGPGALLLAVAWFAVPLFLAPLLPGGAVTVFAALFLMGLGVPALRVMIDILVFQQVAEELRGRVIAATMTLFTVGMPAGLFGSGVLLDHVAPGTALAVLALLLALGLLPATFDRTLRRAGWPA